MPHGRNPARAINVTVIDPWILNPICSAVETSAERREPGFTDAASRTPKLVRLCLSNGSAGLLRGSENTEKLGLGSTCR
jgi:hypothetical protein